MGEANKKVLDFYAKMPYGGTSLPFHMHYGFYDEGTTVIADDQEAAKTRMIEEALQFADIQVAPKTIIDVGCGIGGSTFYLGKKYGAKCVGINIDPIQIQEATEIAQREGIRPDQVSFEVGDALQLPIPDDQFDLVWTAECAEHLSKSKFVSELIRVAAPGGTILILTTCLRDLAPDEKSYTADEEDLIKTLSETHVILDQISAADYVRLFSSQPVKNLKCVDWNKHILPGCQAGIGADYTETPWTQGRKMGLLKYTVVTCNKAK